MAANREADRAVHAENGQHGTRDSAELRKKSARSLRKSVQKGQSRKIKKTTSGGQEEVMFYEAIDLLGKDVVDHAVDEDRDYAARFERFHEIELDVVAMSSHGERDSTSCHLALY